MSTISSRKIIDDIIAGDYADDGWIKIVEYTDMGGKRTWGCVAERDPNPDRYERESAYIRDPKVIWERQ